MLIRKKGIDIVKEIGGITGYEGAMKLLENKLDKENLSRIKQIKNKDALMKIANAIAMCEPDNVFINTGS